MKFISAALIIIIIPSICILGQNKNVKDIYDYPIPKNLNESFKLLDKTLKDEVIFLIKTLPEDSILTNKVIEYETDFPFAWKLYESSRLTKFFHEKGLFNSNDIYETILISYHRYLNKKEINLEKQIAKYKALFEKEALINFEKDFEGQNEKLLYKGIRITLTEFIKKKKEFVELGITKSFNNLTVCIDGFPPNFYFESMIEGITINYISLIDYSDNEKKLQKGMGILILSPIEINTNKLEINLAYFSVKLLGKTHFNMSYLDSMKSIYEYSCERKEWILIETKYGSV